MITRFTISLLIFSLFVQTLATVTLAIASHARFNISHFLYPRIADELRPQPSPFLEDVLTAISVRQNWSDTGGIRVSKLDSGNAKFGDSRRFEFRLRIGKSEVIFRLRDEVASWKKLKNGGDFEASAIEIGSAAVLDRFRVRGPFELQVDGADELSLQLPLNATYTGLKRILVGEGILVEVRNAQQVSLFHALRLGLQANTSFATSRERSDFFWPFEHTSCMPLLPIHISGPASVVAYRTQNRTAYIETAFLSKDTMELLPDKCYLRNANRKQSCPIDFLRLRIALVEKLLKSFLSDRILLSRVLSFLKVKTKASRVVRFKMELQRDIRSNDTLQGTLAEWRTRPAVERVCYEVVARIDRERLKPLVIKKVRPFIEAHRSTWSDLLSNISFTKFPSLLAPPEALTLDVKW